METIPREDLVKTCTTCKQTKPLSEFVPRAKSQFYQLSAEKQHDPLFSVLSRCVSCYNEYHVQWRAKKDEEYRAYARAQYHKNKAKMAPEVRKEWMAEQSRKNQVRYYALKEKVYAAYGGYVCACCGETQPEFLTLDHVNNDGHAHRKSMNGNQGGNFLKWIVANNYPNSIQVLCWNCQWGKNKNNGICPHQVTRNDYP
jgi:hypothetical protein